MSVVDFSYSETTSLAGKNSPTKLPPELVAQQKVYRNLVLKDLIDSEKAHVAELQGLLKNFLHPLEKSEMWVLILYNYLFIIKTVILLHVEAMKLKVLIKQFNKMYKPWIFCHFCCFTNLMVPVICGFPLRLSVLGIVYVCSICLLQMYMCIEQVCKYACTQKCM